MRGIRRFVAAQSCAVGRGNPAACAIAGRWIIRFVDPPNAACTVMAFRTDASVRISRVWMPRRSSSSTARADRRAISLQIGCPDGANAACVNVNPSASPTTCDVAAVPRNWQPPPGDAHARHRFSAACSSVISPCANRAPTDCTRPASSPSSASSVTPPGTRMHGKSGVPASASIMAGRPLSHVATPMTPLRVGSDRICRRKIVAASFRYGRESYMPGVPCVRPSHGSVQYAAKGIAPADDSSSAAASISSPTSQCPV